MFISKILCGFSRRHDLKYCSLYTRQKSLQYHAILRKSCVNNCKILISPFISQLHKAKYLIVASIKIVFLVCICRNSLHCGHHAGRWHSIGWHHSHWRRNPLRDTKSAHVWLSCVTCRCRCVSSTVLNHENTVVETA